LKAGDFDLILTDWSTHGIDANQTGRVRQALNREKIGWVSEDPPSTDFEIWFAASLRCLQGAVFFDQ